MLSLGTIRDLVTQFRCLSLTELPEIFGPTDINAQTANQRLAVALNDAGTVTVFRWPRPSFYDHVKYRTRSRSEPRFGVAPNEGAFLGLQVTTDRGTDTQWLRSCERDQRYCEGLTDTVETTYRSRVLGLTVRVTDVVARDVDALVREVTVERQDDTVESASLVAYENMNLVTSKAPRNPVQGWCREDENTDTAIYDPDLDAIVHTKIGVDESTDQLQQIAVGMGFESASVSHQVGSDAFESDNQNLAGTADDAYVAATRGALPGTDRYVGQTTGAMTTPLSFEDGVARETVVFAAGEETAQVRDAIETVRTRGAEAVRAEKRDWLETVLADAPLPATDDEAVRKLARRAIVTLVTNYDPDSGAIVASIATQNPYALDWPRDGAFFNVALHVLGLDEWVEQRNRWYATLQQADGEGPIGQLDIPDGNWAMNYYGDGVVGGPIPWEIDQTAYAVWTLWDHYAVTGDRSYLEAVYPAIRRSGEFFCAHRDPETGLHDPAHEDDNVIPSRTIVGAGPVWLAMDCASKAARELGHERDAEQFEARRDELTTAIDAHLWDTGIGAYTDGIRIAGVLGSIPHVSKVVRYLPFVPDPDGTPAISWPVGFKPPDDPRMRSHLKHVWKHITATFAEPETGDRRSGMYETLGLIALAQAWRDDEDRMAQLHHGIEWIAHEHATRDTHVMGEMWIARDGDIKTIVSQPHTWTQILFYLASLEAYPPDGFDDTDERSAIAWLRNRRDTSNA